MVDLLAVCIAWLQNDAALASLVGGRIAAKHRYASDWQRGQASVVVHLDGGAADLYAPIQYPRVEVRCYGGASTEAVQVASRVAEMTRQAERQVVSVGGNAFLYSARQASGLSLLYDQEVDMDVCILFLDLMVAENTV